VSEGGNGAQRTSGCALIIACLRVRCGSSVYVQKKSVWPGLDFAVVVVWVAVDDIVAVVGGAIDLEEIELRSLKCRNGNVAHTCGWFDWLRDSPMCML